ncbi:MAG TPA: hypothetical protein VGS41_15345, partial [Chthonomonadales bacterium]|nr:hypothetical protein [Chthonomonadales bacterium]
MPNKSRVDRRTFLKQAVSASAGAALFHVVPASALGRGGRIAPSNRIAMGCIGVGGQGTSNMGVFLGQPDCHVVAVCDVDKNHVNNAKSIVDNHYGATDCATYADYRDILSRQDLDVIS